MPNWCENILTVSGPTEEVDRFMEDNIGDEGESLVFSKAVPEPTYEGYTDSSSKTSPASMPDWYNWRIANWGTKWEPDIDLGIQQETNVVAGAEILTATYYFSTAWGPGDAWFEKAVSKYPKLRFSYVYGEPGGDFGGAIVAVGGKIISNIEGEAYDFLPEPDWV